jgi:hypothetical protein
MDIKCKNGIKPSLPTDMKRELVTGKNKLGACCLPYSKKGKVKFSAFYGLQKPQ